MRVVIVWGLHVEVQLGRDVHEAQFFAPMERTALPAGVGLVALELPDGFDVVGVLLEADGGADFAGCDGVGYVALGLGVVEEDGGRRQNIGDCWCGLGRGGRKGGEDVEAPAGAGVGRVNFAVR